jgi:PAS domain S-box-containing protein
MNPGEPTTPSGSGESSGLECVNDNDTDVLSPGQVEYYRLALQTAQVGIWDWDLQTNRVYNDPNLKMLLGYSDQELPTSYEEWIELIFADDRPGVETALQNYLAGRSSEFVTEYRMRHRDGSLRWFLARGNAFWDEAGQPCRILGNRTEITERKRLEEAMQQAIEQEQQIRERERLIATIAQNIRRSLNLNEILTTTVNEVRRFLNADRVVIYRFNPDWSGKIIAESVVADSRSIQNETITDTCFLDTMAVSFRQGHIHIVNDVQASGLQPCYVEMLSSLDVRAVLALPVLVHDNLWGLLIAHECKAPRQWQQISWYLLRQLSTQVAIAIQQSELYQQIQALNTNLENQVQQRTDELQRSLEFEALLKRITDKVRSSLDEAQILQTVVQELAQGLNVQGCDVGLFDFQQKTLTIEYEYTTPGFPEVNVASISFDNVHEGFAQLQEPIPRQFCCIENPPCRPVANRFAILHCSITDDQAALGNMWLFRERERTFSEPEVRLVQQVAGQCAIAIRQARLYQAAQAQVTELERLSRLKDDFLSTVSHELRTPVSSIKMATQLLRIHLQEMVLLNSGEESPLFRYLEILQTECQREIDLINNLLDLTRLDAEAEPLLCSTINLEAWLAHVVEPFMEPMRERQQQLELQIASDLPTLSVDLSYLQRLVTELMTNAHKYTPSGERITVAANYYMAGDRHLQPMSANFRGAILLQVTNTGAEISAEEIPRIFDKFYRIPSNDPWSRGGTGLGLALVKKLSERIGATIQAESSNQQVTFTLQMPVE